jgi:transposase
MNATTTAIDLAKNVFQVALADSNHQVLEQQRLTRMQFERFFDNRKVSRVVMEACGSADHWARVFAARGIEVILLPAHYVRAYVRRSKTDAADALALLEAARCGEIVPVRVKSAEQQSLQALHRTRSLWMGTRTSRINALRGFCRELGLHVPVGAHTGLEAMGRALADEHSPITPLSRPIMHQLLDQICVLQVRVAQLERQLARIARVFALQAAHKHLRVGLLTATAILAATSGSVVTDGLILPRMVV